MLKAVFFDLDGTLLPLNEEKFTHAYFNLLADYMKQYGFEKKEIINIISLGVKAMYLNDGTKTNEEAFWDCFYGLTNDRVTDYKSIFTKFYSTSFLKTIECTEPNPDAVKIIKEIKNLGLKVILTTNPIFPAIATNNRMGFIGLKLEDFDYVTSYENSKYTKPNPLYFKEVMDLFDLKSDEVIFFGNNTKEDGDASRELGIRCYLVTGNIIFNVDSGWNYKKIKMDQILDIVRDNLNK